MGTLERITDFGVSYEGKRGSSYRTPDLMRWVSARGKDSSSLRSLAPT